MKQEEKAPTVSYNKWERIRAIWALLTNKHYIVIAGINSTPSLSTVNVMYTRLPDYFQPTTVFTKLADIIEEEAKKKGNWLNANQANEIREAWKIKN